MIDRPKQLWEPAPESKRQKVTKKVIETPESLRDEMPKQSKSSTAVKPDHGGVPDPPPGKCAPRSMTLEIDTKAKKANRPKIDVKGNLVADKNKSSVLRKLYVNKCDRNTRDKDGGKSVKSEGEKQKRGKYSPGVIVINLTSPTPPPAMESLSLPPTPSPRKLVQHSTPPISLMCRIDLSKVDINNIDFKKRSEEIKTKMEPPETRQAEKKHKSTTEQKIVKKRVKFDLPGEQVFIIPAVPVKCRKRPNPSPQASQTKARSVTI